MLKFFIITLILSSSIFSLNLEDTKNSSNIINDSLKIKPISNGIILSIGWAFGESKELNSWSSYLDTIYKSRLVDLNNVDTNYSFSGNFIQKPTSQKILYPISIGYYRDLLENNAIYVGITYASQNKKAIYKFKAREDSTKNYTEESSYSYHSGDIVITGYQFFDKKYFSINGSDRAGISLSIGYSPYSIITTQYFHNSDINILESMGYLWGVTLFTENIISKFAIVRYSLSYSNKTFSFKNNSSSSNQVALSINFILGN